MKKKKYIAPVCVAVNVTVCQMLASSITGSAPDSDDTEFGAPEQRRGEWGDLWEDKWE